MNTIINKTPIDILSAYKANKPKNGSTSLFLVRDGADIPIYGIHIVGDDIYIIKSDLSEVLVQSSDTIELRT